MSDDVPEQYRPRLCHVVKWADFQGYGFNLHAEKGKAGQFIGKVDENSPAEAAGLKDGDRIVEVNGINIGNENHQQVVTRIKSGGEETRLLVVDFESDNWYKEEKKVVKGDLPEVKFISAKRDGDDDQEPAAPPYPEAERQPEPETEPEPNVEPEVEETVVTNSFSASVANGNGVDDVGTHKPRLCHLKLWPHFQGYGFNLHAERDKPGQYIGLVDDNSPASTAGLLVNDRIIEVNGVNIEAETHTDVIARIKAVPGEAKLLVVDRDTDQYLRDRGITISSSLAQTEYIVTPDAADAPAQAEEVVAVETQLESLHVDNDVDRNEEAPGEDEKEMEEAVKEKEEDEKEKEEEVVMEDKKEEKIDNDEAVVREFHIPPPPPAEELNEEKEEEHEETVNGTKTQAPAPSQPEPEFTVASNTRQEYSAAAPAANNSDGLELNLSVAEMKERIKAKKRQDPRLNKVSFEQKYKEFQRM